MISEEPKNTSFDASPTANCAVTASPYLMEPEGVQIARLSIEIGAALVGVIGNLLVTILAPRGRKLRSTDAFYIRSLAIADLGILLVNFPFAVIREQSPNHWLIGKEMCYLLYPVSEVFHGACVWSIAAIAFERYRGIVHGIHQTLRSTKITIAAIWLGSFAIFVVPLFFIVRYEETSCYEICVFIWPVPILHDIYIGLDAMLLYVVPLGLVTFTYLRITREIRESSTLHRMMGLSSVRRHEELKLVKQNARTARLLTNLVIVFTITMLPLNASRVIIMCWGGFTRHRLFLVFYNIAVLGVVLNSAADPVIYSIVTKDFISKLRCKSRGWQSLKRLTSAAMRNHNDSVGSNQTNL